MPRPAVITRASVAQAIEQLRAEGKEPSRRAVHGLLGGSMTTISRVMAEIESSVPGVATTLSTDDLAAELKAVRTERDQLAAELTALRARVTITTRRLKERANQPAQILAVAGLGRKAIELPAQLPAGLAHEKAAQALADQLGLPLGNRTSVPGGWTWGV